MAEEKTEKNPENEREYIIPLRRRWAKVPRYKRANKAIRTIKEFLARHMKVRDRDLNKIKLDKFLNEAVWLRGIRNPPFKIKVKAIREGDIIRAELAEMPDKIKFKKARLDKREQKATEIVSKKKAEKPAEEKAPEKTEEEKKEEKEKAKAGEEAMIKIEKAAAKRTKHTSRASKQPKHQARKALAK